VRNQMMSQRARSAGDENYGLHRVKAEMRELLNEIIFYLVSETNGERHNH
jgi:hypothetical protein